APCLPRRARRGRGLPGPGGAIALRQGRHARDARLGRRLGERDPEWRAVRVDVSADASAGYTYGFGSATGRFGSGGAARWLPAKYIAYWRKNPTGAWKVAAYVRVFQRVTAPADPPPGFASPHAQRQ